MSADLKRGLALARRIRTRHAQQEPKSHDQAVTVCVPRLIERMQKHGWYESMDHHVSHKDYGPGVYWFDSWEDAILGVIDVASGA